MATPIKFLPLGGINTDLSNQLMKSNLARFIKNLTYLVTDNQSADTAQGTEQGVMKPLQSPELYCPIQLPDGENYCIGTCTSKTSGNLFVFVWNGYENHTIFYVNGKKQQCQIVKIDKCFNFILDPRYFIHESAAWVEVITLIDPVSGLPLVKEDLYWTDGFNPMGYIRITDCVATNGFDDSLYPYFQGDYDRCDIFRMGLPTPKSCIDIKEVPVTYEPLETFQGIFSSANDPANNVILIAGINPSLPPYPTPQPLDQITVQTTTGITINYIVINTIAGIGGWFITVEGLVPPFAGTLSTITVSRLNNGNSNNLLFNTWQFRIMNTDVFGRPSIYGIISDMYIPGINDCLTLSASLPNCLDLTFDAGNPFINSIEIAWRNCNTDEWKTETTLFKYNGSNIGQWWNRGINPDINWDQNTNKITYRFCRNKQCDPIDPLTTNLLAPALPKTCQSLFPLNNLIATANNKDGFNPFSLELRKKITADIIPPTASNDLRNITIYVAIGNMDQQVMPRNGKFYYGGQMNGGLSTDLCDAKKQFFANPEQSGFCGILINGPSCISTQVYIDAFGNVVDDPTFDGYNLSPTHRTLQKFVFNNVPKGCYRFLITSPTTDPVRDSNYRTTSCPIWAVCPFSAATDYFLDFNNRTGIPSCELFIDVCNGDYDTLQKSEMLVICNMAAPFVYSQCGYFYESETNSTRWELLKIPQFDGFVSSIRTDANGFYWVYRRGDTSGATINFSAITYVNCLRAYGTKTLNFGSADMVFQDYFMSTFIVNPEPFKVYPCNVIHIRGRLVLGNTNVGISGAYVSLTRGSFSGYTDANGVFDVICHDDGSNENPYGVRNDRLVIDTGACSYTYANGQCIGAPNVQIISCSITTPGECRERNYYFNFAPFAYKQKRGLVSNGTYPLFVNGYDWLGRKTYSQPLGDIKIPSIIQTRSIAPSTVQINIDPSAIFPQDIRYLTFSIGEEVTMEKYLTWIVDRAELINNKGEIDIISPSQIRVYYQSLVEYNKVNNYNTTTAWQFIPQNESNPVTTDRVQFWINGDGTYFNSEVSSIVKYDQSGTFFTIDYTSELANLKPNALMRLIRPKSCNGNQVNYEVCKVVDVVNQKAQETQFILNAFDTYYVSRLIPVPAPVDPNASTISQIATTVNNVDGSVTTYEIPPASPTVLSLQAFGFTFEHPCPSNFWGQNADGTGCNNKGRLNSINPYEAEIIHQDQIAFGGALSDNGQLNYLQYFIPTNKHSFNIPNTGGIVYVSPKQGILLVITQFNNFTVGYGDTLVRTDSNGNILAPSGQNTFGNPNIQLSGNYGCQIWDKNTIRERDGLVHFLDTSRVAVLQHNFKDCEDISSNKTNPGRMSTILSWLAKKIAFVKEYNNDPRRISKKFFVSVINPVNNEWLLSDFILKGGDVSYVNEERDYNVEWPENMAFDMKASVWKGMYSPTPEYWGYLESELYGNQLFAFRKGLPYSFYSPVNTNYNTFFGVKCNRVFEFVMNLEMMKKFKPRSLEVYCKQSGYFADRIITEAGQESRILISQWKQGEYFYSAPFLKDMNTLVDPNNPAVVTDNPLFEGWPLYGTWVKVRLIGYPDFDDVYSALEGVQGFLIGESNSGIRQ